MIIINNNVLGIKRNPMEMSQSCRGTISLVSAVIHTEDICNFVITNGGTQTFHLKATNEIERQKWVTALELAKVRAIRLLDSEDDDIYDINYDKNELQTVLKSLSTKLETLHTCHDVIIKHGSALQRSLIELEQLDNPNDAINKSKTVNERATLFRITSSAMINASAEYLTLAQTHGRKWQKLLQHEHESRLRLEELVEQLAKQHSHLEQRAIKQVANANSPNVNSANSDDDEFYDAEETNADFIVTFPGKAHRISNSSNIKTQNEKINSNTSTSAIIMHNNDDESSGSEDSDNCEESAAGVITRKKSRGKNLALRELNTSNIITKVVTDNDADSSKSSSTPSTPISAVDKVNNFIIDNDINPKRMRRTKIPERPNQSLNLWFFMKNCIGKELTKIPMPVNFNEPLSMLQRLTEDYEYADLLHKASKIKDSCEQLAYIAAFSVTSYATTSNRTGKPFNPLLGETYECDRTDDLGWKCFSEQVCLTTISCLIINIYVKICFKYEFNP